MPADENHCLRQVRRMGGLDFTPQTPEAWVELGDVLRRHASTDEHAARIISRWIENESACPKPRDLAAYAANVPPDPNLDNPVLPGPCDECAPEGLFVFDEKAAALKRCDCTRGQILTLLDQRRFKEQEKRARESGGIL